MKKIQLAVLILICACAVRAQETLNKGCPELELFTSLNDVVIGDRITFNIVATGGSLSPSELKFTWRVIPRGRITTSGNTTSAILDTSTVKGDWAIVSVDFANFRKCSWSASSGDINIRRKGPYTKIDAFWWWFQLNSEHFRAFKMPGYNFWLEMLGFKLGSIDPSLTFTIDHERLDPLKRALIISSRPYNAKLLDELVGRAPNLAGWEVILSESRSKAVTAGSIEN